MTPPPRLKIFVTESTRMDSVSATTCYVNAIFHRVHPYTVEVTSLRGRSAPSDSKVSFAFRLNLAIFRGTRRSRSSL